MNVPGGEGVGRDATPAGGARCSVAVTDRQTRLPIDPDAIVSLVRFALHAEAARGAVEVVFVDDLAIAELHLRFMDIPGPTDVITFPLDDDSPLGSSETTSPGDAPLLGEIVVSTDTACRQAPDYGMDPLDEAHLYVVHGVLHLLGYDDRTDSDADRMATRQREIFESWRGRG